MIRTTAAILLALLFMVPAADAAADRSEAQRLETVGMQAMQAANQDSRRGVDAAVALTEARAIYHGLEDWDKVRELNSYLFWCRKRMNLEELDDYISRNQGAAAAVAAVEKEGKRSVRVEDGADYLRRADAYAAANPDQHFLIHVRYLEIAERFETVNTELAIRAMRRSSEALEHYAQSLESQPAPAEPTKPAPPVVEAPKAPTGPDPLSLDTYAITLKEWDALEGVVFRVQARLEANVSEVRLEAGQTAKIFPHPSDTWSWSTTKPKKKGPPSVDRQSCRATGLEGGRSGRIEVGLSQQGPWKKLETPIAGPGLLVFHPVPLKGAQGGGGIRVKIVVLPAGGSAPR